MAAWTGEDGGVGFLGDKGGTTVLLSAATLRWCWARLAAMLAWSCRLVILDLDLAFVRMVVLRC